LSISPGQVAAPGVPPNRVGKTVGGRLSAGLYRYSFQKQTAIKGQAGFIVEGYGGLEFPSGLELVGGLSLGLLGADSLGTEVRPKMLEMHVRADYVRARAEGAAGGVVQRGGVPHPHGRHRGGDLEHELPVPGGGRGGHQRGSDDRGRAAALDAAAVRDDEQSREWVRGESVAAGCGDTGAVLRSSEIV
jgi:hypothetical protein